MKFFLLLLASALAIPTPETKKDYSGYVVLRVIPATEEQLTVLNKYAESNILDFWQRPSQIGVPVDVNVAPKLLSNFKRMLRQLEIEWSVMIEDVQIAINVESASIEERSVKAEFNKIVGTYPRHKAVNQWLTELASANSFVETRDLGKTTEDRIQRQIRISTGPGRKIIWMDAAIHAREWITVSSAVYFIDQLIKGVNNNDPSVIALTNKYDFHILPVANPDGYEYTLVDRMWRKTRTYQGRNIYGQTCYGADPNRNWDFHFNEVGTSANKCSDIYPGPRAFSEPETRNMRDDVLTDKNKITAYISFHSYSQMWLTPWGYTKTQTADHAEMMRVANIGATATKRVNGNSYRVGPPSVILYPAAGGSFDWAKGVAGIKYSYTLELFPSQYNSKYRNGFILPTSEIMPVARETYAGVLASVKSIP